MFSAASCVYGIDFIADTEEVDGGSHLIRKSVYFKNTCSNTLHWVQSVSHVNFHEQVLLRKPGSAQKAAFVEGLAMPFSFAHDLLLSLYT